MNSMENLRFDKEGYFRVSVFYGLFYKMNRKHPPPRVPLRYRNTGRSLCMYTVWKHGKCFYFLNNKNYVLHLKDKRRYKVIETKCEAVYHLTYAVDYEVHFSLNRPI